MFASCGSGMFVIGLVLSEPSRPAELKVLPCLCRTQPYAVEISAKRIRLSELVEAES